MEIAEILEAMARGLLPDGHTYENHDPVDAVREMRVDVIASHAVAAIVSSTADPLLLGIYRASRPVIDGILTGAVRPAAPVRRVRKVRKVRKQEPRVELGTRSSKVDREILDAEFVDL